MVYVKDINRNMPTTRSEPQLVSWRFEPNQPQRIISGLKETFIRRYIVERTIKAEFRKRRVVGRIYGMNTQLKGP